MENLELESIKALLFLIDKFNHKLDIKYIIDDTTFQSLDKFILNNGQYLLETIDYINVYIDMFNRLNELDLDSNLNLINISCSSDIYSLEYLESLLEIYNNNKNNYVVVNILNNQRFLLNNCLTKCKLYVSKLLKILDIYVKLIDGAGDKKYIDDLYNIIGEDSDDDDSSSSLNELLNQFGVFLKSVYGIKKKNVKIKVLTRG